MNYTCTSYPNNRANLYIKTRKTSFKRSSVINYHSHNKIRRFWNKKTLILYRYINKHEDPPAPCPGASVLVEVGEEGSHQSSLVTLHPPGTARLTAVVVLAVLVPLTARVLHVTLYTVRPVTLLRSVVAWKIQNKWRRSQLLGPYRQISETQLEVVFFFFACWKGPKRCFCKWKQWLIEGGMVFLIKNVQCKSNQICFSTNVYIQHHSIVIYLTIWMHCCSTYWFFIEVREHKCLWI